MKQTKQVDFGKRSGLKVYPVSIGAMRLPQDDQEAVSLLREAIDANMVYIDTSRGYGDSEIKVGKALKDGWREKVILSTKWSPWAIKMDAEDKPTADYTYKRIMQSLERLDVEYVDFYQLWSISNAEQYKQATQKGGMLDGIMWAKDEGLIKHVGMTTHDKPENISRYIDEADWCEAILFTYNIMNQTYKDTIAKAHEKGIATIVMNPVGGGMFAENSPTLNKTTKDAVGIEDAVEVAHRYLVADENVDTIVCGISKPSDIKSTVENYQKPPLTTDQREAIEEAMKKLSSNAMGFCTGCKYCMPCPKGIHIPEMMNVIYFEKMLQVGKRAKDMYDWYLGEVNANASAHPAECIECGECEQKCTQKLKIIKEIKYLAQSDFYNK